MTYCEKTDHDEFAIHINFKELTEVLKSLENRETKEAEKLNDSRFDDPSYLAARYVVYLAKKFSSGNPIDFRSIGIVDKDPEDIEYRYVVNCGLMNEAGQPTGEVAPKVKLQEIVDGKQTELVLAVPEAVKRMSESEGHLHLFKGVVRSL